MYTHVQDIKNGNTEVFNKCYEHFHPRLTGYIYKHTRSRFLTEETVQMTFVKLWENRASLSDTHDISSQLFRIAKSTLIDLLRKEAVRQSQEMTDAVLNNLDNSMYVHPRPEQKDELSFVLKGIEHLPPICSQVFKLSRFEGLSYQQIADQLAISPKTVETHIHRAIRQLKGIIGFFF